MFLGRSTIAWTGLISSVVAGLQIIVPVLFPGVDPAQTTTVLGTIGVILGAVIAFVANTSTTPTGDPQLKEGTMVRVTDETGTVIGHTPVPTPSDPPPAEPVLTPHIDDGGRG